MLGLPQVYGSAPSNRKALGTKSKDYSWFDMPVLVPETFDFVPRFLAVQHHAGDKRSNASNPEFFYVCGGLAYGIIVGGFGHISADGETVSWYSSGSFAQLNDADAQYNYVAFG